MSMVIHAIIVLIGGDVPRMSLALNSTLLNKNGYFMHITLISAIKFPLIDLNCPKIMFITEYFVKDWQIRHKKIFSYNHPYK